MSLSNLNTLDTHVYISSSLLVLLYARSFNGCIDTSSIFEILWMSVWCGFGGYHIGNLVYSTQPLSYVIMFSFGIGTILKKFCCNKNSNNNCDE